MCSWGFTGAFWCGGGEFWSGGGTVLSSGAVFVGPGGGVRRRRVWPVVTPAKSCFRWVCGCSILVVALCFCYGDDGSSVKVLAPPCLLRGNSLPASTYCCCAFGSVRFWCWIRCWGFVMVLMEAIVKQREWIGVEFWSRWRRWSGVFGAVGVIWWCWLRWGLFRGLW